MSESRAAVLASLRAARPRREASSTPARMGRVEVPGMPGDPLAVLRRGIESAGGRLQQVARETLCSDLRWPVELDRVEHLYSDLPELMSRGAGLEARAGRDLARLELCLIEADFVVVESGAVWHVPRHPLCRAAALLAEHLVVVVDAEALVPTLHQAYDRIDLGQSSFGWLLCGPSKTADIEQALVLGAHGPRTLTLVLASGPI